jgi:hypothetical protein
MLVIKSKIIVTRSIISSTESVDIVLVVLFSNAVLHADYASIRGTVGYSESTRKTIHLEQSLMAAIMQRRKLRK